MGKPFSVHILDDYSQERFNKLANREGYNKKGGGKVYGCSSAVPTGGYGFALIVNGQQGWGIRKGLQEDLQSVGADLTKHDKENLEDIATMHNKKRPVDEIKHKIKQQHYDLKLDEQQSRKIFDRVSDREYEDTLKHRLERYPKKKKGEKKTKEKKVRTGLSDDQIKRIQGTREWVALYSTVYRGSICITSPMVDALKTGNRQETWYVMKRDTAMVYKTRPEGIFNRSSSDANYFGLYDNPNNPTVEEAQNLIEVYKKHTAAIQEYDMAGHKDPFLPYLEAAVKQLKENGKDPGVTLYSLLNRPKPKKKRVPHNPTSIPKKTPVKKPPVPDTDPYLNQQLRQLEKTLDKWETYIRQAIHRRWW